MKSIMHCVISLVIATLVTPAAIAQSSVLTQDYDMSRSGANLDEAILTPSNVSSATFGKLFSYPVDEEVFAQPLYVPKLVIRGGTHNVVFVATMGNTVYAFDADSPATSTTPLWSVNLGAGVPSSKFLYFAGSGVSHNGIYSTPVIDPTTNTIYVVTHLWSTASQSVALQLHALDVATGYEKLGGPVQIAAPGFDANLNEQRAGLLLLNGTVYVALASHADFVTNLSTLKHNPYVGMVLAYDAQTLAGVGTFNAEPGGIGAAIWQGGRGLASDGTYIYAMTANAMKLGTVDYSESFVQLNPRTLSVAGYYQDPDSACLNTLDLDLASSGPQVIPGAGTNLLVGGGKEGKVYTLQLDQALHSQTPQYFWGTSNYPTLPAEGGTCADTRGAANGWLQGSDTAFWNNPSGASYYYSFGNRDQLISWAVSGNAFTQTSMDTPSNLNINALAVSANVGANGILWTVANQTTGIAIVSAYNAVPSAGHLTLLWNSAQVPRRDALGQQGRYSVPTVANGKVYVGSGSNQVVVYGLLPTTPSVEVTPQLGTLAFTALNTKAENIFVNSVGGYTGQVILTLTGLPPGLTYSFAPASVNLTSMNTSVATSLSISPAGAVLPLSDNYTVLVQASAAGGSTSSAPIRLLMRNALFTSVTKVGCNSSNQMSASLSWQINGSAVPSLWIQDTTTPTFPGRLWVEPAAVAGTEQTGYSIDNKTGHLIWLIDQSAGIPANFDNALKYTNLGFLYSCP
jgi:PQQ-like domain